MKARADKYKIQGKQIQEENNKLLTLKNNFVLGFERFKSALDGVTS